jgi:hypothetical protein
MNCAAVRARLASFEYGDLTDAEADQVREHLRRCPSCAQERSAVTEVRRLLDAVPAPAVAVDLPRLYKDALSGQVRRLRLWRGVAVAALAAAAIVAALLLSRLELRVDANQLVLRWGAVPAAPDPKPVPPPATPRQEESPVPPPLMSTAEIDQQLRMLRELVQVVSNDADQRDERRRDEIARLQGRVHGLEQQLTQLRLAMARDVALSAARLPEKQKGAPQ